ncbi:hypothetical protein Cgig2_005313 [Carnegiea gigantea]|uniref:Homeobox domain-containing protein n=1 Tax=Carnegiea gigantea TaxID=171969 RepID=A0A9Q1GLY7_9CARY|nr:hypothetical protein Cgig2_005313 [Carnegiea gigantea]
MEEDHHHNDHDQQQQQQNHDDHDEDQERGSSSGVGGSRWNPTKEQIALLEKMYNEGVRTPSAEQIQQITGRLKEHGHIEGKNVFYWFQNHKARQRQKQRQQRLVANQTLHINHIHHPTFLPPQHYHPNPHPNHSINLNLHPKPIFPALPPSNYRPTNYHYLPNPNATVPPAQYHNSAPASSHNLPTGCSRAPSGAVSMMISVNNAAYDDHLCHLQDQNVGVRTLDLFPVHPTGILEHKVRSTNSTNSSSATNSSIDTHTSDTGNQQQQRLFDFFSSESD